VNNWLPVSVLGCHVLRRERTARRPQWHGQLELRLQRFDAQLVSASVATTESLMIVIAACYACGLADVPNM